MDNRGANIDLVFRNGLKDYEVLPPTEVWDNIHPKIKVVQPRYIFLKVAATVTILATVSYFAYQLNREVITFPEFNSVAMNIEAGTPVLSPEIISSSVSNNVRVRPAQLPYRAGINSIPVNESIIYEDQPSLSVDNNSQEINSLTPDNSLTQQEPLIIDFSALPARTFVAAESGTLFVPDMSSLKKTDRWSIGAFASPTINSRVTTNKNDISKMLATSEHSIMSYSGGVAVSWKLNKRITVQSGLYYSSMGQELDGVGSFSGFRKYDYTKGANNFDLLTTSGVVRTNNADVFLTASERDRVQTLYNIDVFDPNKANLKPIDDNLLQKFSFLELPVVLRYKIIDKAVDFNLIGGLSYNMLINNSVYTYLEGEKYIVGETIGLNPVSISSSLGMGMEYSFSKKLSFNLEPTFRYYLNPFSNVNGAESHPYSFGIFSGFSYKF